MIKKSKLKEKLSSGKTVSLIVLGLSVVVLVGILIYFKSLFRTADVMEVGSGSAIGIHRLGVRQAGSKQEFYDTVTNASVLLRGNNYIRMTPNGVPNGFAPGVYDKPRNEAALSDMKASGYNSVRVTFVYSQLANDNGIGLSDQYLNNVADYLRMAKEKEMFVFGLIAYLPKTGGYWPANQNAVFEGDYTQKLFLDQVFLSAKKQYVKDVISGLKKKGAPIEIVIWGIENEPFFELSKKPLNMSTGFVKTANGATYNMAVPEDKKRMIDDNLAFYMDSVRSSIREIDPEAIVGMSLMSPISVQRTGNILKTGKLFNESLADFIDVHIYPRSSVLTTAEELSSYEMGSSQKPLILGEYGAYPKSKVPWAYDNIQDGAIGLRDLQVITCKDYGFKGWYAYDWDTTELTYGFRIYQVTESGGVINRMLAPKYRANPCSPDPVAMVGKVESVSGDGLIKGWVFDQESLGSTKVNFYIDGPYPTNGTMIGGVKSDVYRLDVVRNSPWMNPMVGFSYQIPSSIMQDGKVHTIYAQALDVLPDGKNSSYLIPGSGVKVGKVGGGGAENRGAIVTTKCGTNVVKPSVCAPNSDYELAVTGVKSSKPLIFATWNTEKNLDDQKNYQAKNMGNGTWNATIVRDNHPGSGEMYSNIWYYDANGKQQWCVQIALLRCDK